MRSNKHEYDLVGGVKEINFKADSDYPFISIIIQNKNGKKDTIECIKSLDKLNYPKNRLEVIIVDSRSDDGSARAIRGEFRNMQNSEWFNLELIELTYDKGVPYSYNLALKKANPDYEYMWKLDNDVILEENSLYELVKTGESSDKIGIIGGKVLYHDSNEIWATCASYLWFLGVGRHIGKGKDANCDKYNSIASCQYLPGCSILIKREVIEQLSGFCEYYFIYYDDTEFTYRSFKRGYLNVYVPTAIIWHKVHKTIKGLSPRFVYYRTRNSFVFIKRNYSFSVYIAYLILSLLIYFPYYLMRYSRRRDVLKSYLLGIKEGIFYRQ